LRDFAVVNRRDTLRFILLRGRVPVLRDVLTDFLACRRLVCFELALGLLTTFATAFVAAVPIPRRFSAAFPARAPATPPTTAPIGPTILPTAAPATAPAVCFGIGGISIFLDEDEVCSFPAFGLSAIESKLL
jgi:hypothetical protein